MISACSKGRVEAIIAIVGGGDRVLNIGCGNSFLLHFTYRLLWIILQNVSFIPVRRIGYGHFGHVHHFLA